MENICFECDECRIVFYDCSQYFRHRVDHNKIPSIVDDNILKVNWTDCPMYPKRCQTLKTFAANITHTNDLKFTHKWTKPYEPYECNHCLKLFSTRGSLSNHKWRKHNPNIYPCDICNKTFPNNDILKKHKYMHNELELKCNICSNLYNSEKATLAKIKKIHDIYCKQLTKPHRDNGKNIECNICSKVCRTKIGLRTHIILCHDPNRTRPPDATHLCDICGYIFFKYEHLIRHRLLHETMDAKIKSITSDISDTKDIKPNEPEHRLNQTKNELQCEYCSLILPSPAKLITHKNVVHKNKQVIVILEKPILKVYGPSRKKKKLLE